MEKNDKRKKKNKTVPESQNSLHRTAEKGWKKKWDSGRIAEKGEMKNESERKKKRGKERKR
jgi:hypothetical protein